MLFPSEADRDVVALRPQDLRHHRPPGGAEREAAAHRAAAGREGPGAGRGRQGNQPHLRGGEGAERPQGAARAGMEDGDIAREEQEDRPVITVVFRVIVSSSLPLHSM